MNSRERRVADRRLQVSRKVLRGFEPARFRAARDAARLSRNELGRLADLSVGTIRAWEVGAVSPQIDTLARAVNVLRVPITEVVPLDDNDLYIADLRIRAGMTQPQLASAAGIPTTTLAALERGTLRMQDRYLAGLSRGLGVPQDVVGAAYHRTRHRPPEYK